jgi:hypothetical protein
VNVANAAVLRDAYIVRKPEKIRRRKEKNLLDQKGAVSRHEYLREKKNI